MRQLKQTSIPVTSGAKPKGASTIITTENVQRALEPLRKGFQADGADLAVQSADDSKVTVRLVLTEAACMDCIVNTGVLSVILEDVLRREFPDMKTFMLEDPRER